MTIVSHRFQFEIGIENGLNDSNDSDPYVRQVDPQKKKKEKKEKLGRSTASFFKLRCLVRLYDSSFDASPMIYRSILDILGLVITKVPTRAKLVCCKISTSCH